MTVREAVLSASSVRRRRLGGLVLVLAAVLLSCDPALGEPLADGADAAPSGIAQRLVAEARTGRGQVAHGRSVGGDVALVGANHPQCGPDHPVAFEDWRCGEVVHAGDEEPEQGQVTATAVTAVAVGHVAVGQVAVGGDVPGLAERLLGPPWPAQPLRATEATVARLRHGETF